MGYPYFQVTAKQKALDKIANCARKVADLSAGDPVLAIGGMRIILLPVAAEKLVEAEGSPGAANYPAPANRLKKILGAMGAQGVDPITAERVRELLIAREAAELTVSRIADTPRFIDGYDWHLKNTRLVEAWALLGEPGAIDWQDIRVGHIDTGFRPIPALGFTAGAGASWVDTSNDRNFFSGDFSVPDHEYPPSSDADPYSAIDPLRGGAFDGHGTRTSSVFCGFDCGNDGSADGTCKGFFGAAPMVPIIPVRICDSVIINHVQRPLADAIHHLVRSGCCVISLSMGMALTAIDPRTREAIDYAYENGVILVCAAGNIWDPVVAPANMNRTISVGGSTPSDVPWLGSSSGPEVDLCAPAWPIRRATVDRAGKPRYGVGDGTSFATPLVAGTAALWLRYRGSEIRRAYPEKWQLVEAFRDLVRKTVRTPAGWNDRRYGRGILDARAVLDSALPKAGELSKDDNA